MAKKLTEQDKLILALLKKLVIKVDVETDVLERNRKKVCVSISYAGTKISESESSFDVEYDHSHSLSHDPYRYCK